MWGLRPRSIYIDASFITDIYRRNLCKFKVTLYSKFQRHLSRLTYNLYLLRFTNVYKNLSVSHLIKTKRKKSWKDFNFLFKKSIRIFFLSASESEFEVSLAWDMYVGGNAGRSILVESGLVYINHIQKGWNNNGHATVTVEDFLS